jgi:hypothetical protein
MDASLVRAAVVCGLLTPLAARGASYPTKNFAVEAPNAEAARRVGEQAEACRKTVASAWLGRELPPWSRPCPIRVKLTDGEAGGLTSFDFSRGRVADQSIRVEGRLDRVLASALPHEVTHTIFAAHYGAPMPRWADEGACLLSEDTREKRRHDRIVIDLLARRGDFPLARLFRMEDYPRDLMGFYGQGYSVSRFLVEIGGRPRFLQFVRDGSQNGWDTAAHTHYGLADCRELDRAWRAWHAVQTEAPSTPDRLVVRAQSADEAGTGRRRR